MSEKYLIQSPLNKLRKDKFRIVLTVPNILKKIETDKIRNNDLINLDSIQFSVIGVSIPNIDVPYHSLPFGGQTHNVTSLSRPPYSPANVKFNIDNEFKNYWIIWKWLCLLNDPNNSIFGGKSVFKDGYPTTSIDQLYDYTSDIVLFSLDEYNQNKVKFIFKNSFVTKLNGFDYDFRDPDEIQCGFDFIFNQFDMELQ